MGNLSLRSREATPGHYWDTLSYPITCRGYSISMNQSKLSAIPCMNQALRYSTPELNSFEDVHDSIEVLAIPRTIQVARGSSSRYGRVRFGSSKTFKIRCHVSFFCGISGADRTCLGSTRNQPTHTARTRPIAGDTVPLTLMYPIELPWWRTVVPSYRVKGFL